MRTKEEREIWQEELTENHFYGTANSRHSDNLSELLDYVTELEDMLEHYEEIHNYADENHDAWQTD